MKNFKPFNAGEVQIGLLVKIANEPKWSTEINGKYLLMLGQVGEIYEIMGSGQGCTCEVWFPAVNKTWSWWDMYLTRYSETREAK